MAKSTVSYIHRKIKCTAERSNTKRPETPQNITKVDYNFIYLRQVKNAFKNIVFIEEVFTQFNREGLQQSANPWLHAKTVRPDKRWQKNTELMVFTRKIL